MSKTDYRRPGSALGGGTNLVGTSHSSKWRSSSSARPTVSTTTTAHERYTSHNDTQVTPDGEYDSDDLNFEAYKKAKWPNAGGINSERASSGIYNSNENLGLHTSEAMRPRGLSASTATSMNAPRGGRLKSMLQSISTRATQTPGVPGGKIARPISTPPHEYATTQARSSSSFDQPRASTSECTNVDPRIPSIDSNSTNSSLPTMTLVNPITRTASGRVVSPSSPTSSSASSSSVNLSIDLGEYHNGIAARKHYRNMTAKLEELRQHWRQDMINRHGEGIKDWELKEGMKNVGFEDNTERLLYHELTEYVVRSKPLGEHWDKAKAQLEANGGILSLGKTSDEHSDGEGYDRYRDDEEDYAEGEQLAEEWKSREQALEGLGDTIDLASVDEQSERPRSSKMRTLQTDLPLTSGPLSAAGTSSQNQYDSDHYLPPRPPSRPGLQHHPSGSTNSVLASQSGSSFLASQNVNSQFQPLTNTADVESDEEEDLPRGKFQNLALNDTLQLRHQQMVQDKPSSAALPPDAVILEPPAPRSVKRPNRVSPPNANLPYTSGVASAAVKANMAHSQLEKERLAVLAAREKEAQLQAQFKREREGQLQKEREMQLQREREAQAQREREAQMAHERDIQLQRERELAAQPPQQRKVAPIPKSRRQPPIQQAQVQQRVLKSSAGRKRPGGAVGTGGTEDGSGAEGRPPSRGYERQKEDESPGGYASDPRTTGRPKHQQQPSHPPRSKVEQWQHDQYGVNGDYSPSVADGSPDQDRGGGKGQNTIKVGEVNGRDPGNKTPAHARVPSRASLESVLSPGGSLLSMSMDEPAATPQQPMSKKKGNIVMINRHEYQVFEMIGRGGSSKVYRVISTRDNKAYAMKRVVMQGVDDEAVRSYAAEIQMLKRLSGNEYIVRLVDDELRGKQQATLLLVMELGEKDFAKILSDRQGRPVDFTWINYHFKQMLHAVNVIHEERIVHSDLKPANFVRIDGILKLIDFGIAKAIANDTTNIQRDSQVGTINYMSPEALNHIPGEDRLKIGRPSDVWSLGCILYQMVYGAAPFAALNMQQKMMAITREDYAIPFSEYSIPVQKTEDGKLVKLEDQKVLVPVQLTEIIKACLQRDAKQRPTISELLQEKWINCYAPDLPPPPAPAQNPNVQQLGPDEAIISQQNMAELINYMRQTHDPNWDIDSPRNIRWVNELVDTVFPQLKALRGSEFAR